MATVKPKVYIIPTLGIQIAKCREYSQTLGTDVGIICILGSLGPYIPNQDLEALDPLLGLNPESYGLCSDCSAAQCQPFLKIHAAAGFGVSFRFVKGLTRSNTPWDPTDRLGM